MFENNRWFLVIPQARHIKIPENQRIDVAALDPGIRTFVSFYSNTLIGKIGEGDFQRIYRLCIAMDKLISKISKAKSKPKRNMIKALKRLRWKIRNLVDDLHKKTAYFLVTHFNKILIPTFETSGMVTKLRSKTASGSVTFRIRLNYRSPSGVYIF